MDMGYAVSFSSYKIVFCVAVRASEEPNGEGAGDDMSGYGLGGKGSFFGFGRFQELQVGRLAMVGFAVISLSFS